MNEALHWGNALEDIVVDEVSRRHPELAKRVAVCPMLEHPTRPYMRANPDRLIVEGSRGRGIIEAKTSLSPWAAKEWGVDYYPRNHFWQVQHYLAVLGGEYTFAVLAGLVSGPSFHVHIIERDPEAIAELEDRCAEFWGCVERRDPLPLVDGTKQTGSALSDLYDGDAEQPADVLVLDGDDDLATAVAAYDRAKAEEAQAKADRIAAENVIKARIGDTHRAAIYGRGINWPIVVSSRFDVPGFKAAHPEMWREFVKTTEGRRFSLSKRTHDAPPY